MQFVCECVCVKTRLKKTKKQKTNLVLTMLFLFRIQAQIKNDKDFVLKSLTKEFLNLFELHLHHVYKNKIFF